MKKRCKPYSGPARRKILWPPMQDEGHPTKLTDGESVVRVLRRWPNDKAASTSVTETCCDCGLQHLVHFGVFLHDRDFYLVRRYWRLNEGKMRCRRKHVKGK